VAQVLVGQPGFKRDDPDYFALTVGNCDFGVSVAPDHRSVKSAVDPMALAARFHCAASREFHHISSANPA
jgi:hypothetical protein